MRAEGQRAGRRRQRERTALSCGEKVAVRPPCGARPALRARGVPAGAAAPVPAPAAGRVGSGPGLLPGEGHPGFCSCTPVFSMHAPICPVSDVRALQGSLQLVVTGVGL